MAIIEGTRAVGGLSVGQPKVARGLYDFAVDGGAVGAITLRGDAVPSGAIIVDTLIQVETVLASGGSATVSIGTEGAADMQSAAAYNAAPWSSTGAKRGTLTATAAPVKTTQKRNITATVGTAALTGGKFQVLVWYVELGS
ncbi:hypothetical protein OG320_05160 [Microbispora sp. NBC_01189]|uniref:hypothetical protein n=1 Tax=Microbispora sp. NBC_01189 TaxID=2903583 RepID=UPI002E15DDC5|nr:hypothetical protein OG320_05160 [Microbispora sp. NBC_01189]